MDPNRTKALELALTNRAIAKAPGGPAQVVELAEAFLRFLDPSTTMSANDPLDHERSYNGAKGGHAAAAAMTPAERSARAKAGAAARWGRETVTVAEAAEGLGKSKALVHLLIKEGRLESRKDGYRRLIVKRSLDKFLGGNDGA